MRSRRPKVLHSVAGAPMISHVVTAAREIRPDHLVVVVGHGGDEVRAALGEEVLYVEQARQMGTGHAVQQTQQVLEGRTDAVMVLYGDVPLIRPDTLRRMLRHHAATQPAITMLTAHLEDPTGYGRVLRDAGGRVTGIVEDAVASDEQHAINEINVGLYVFDADWLWAHLPRIPVSPTGEYYLTDLVDMAVAERQGVEALTTADSTEVLGINTRAQLASAEAVLRERIRARWLEAGVTMIDPSSTWIDAGVQVGRDTVLFPDTYLQGRTVIGEECVIGPGTLIRDSVVGDRCRILFSVIEEAVLEEDVDVGPFSHLRKGAHLGPGVHIGNFGEIKNSRLGRGVKMGHFSYLGDATVGEGVNIGAGTITCNYDGTAKHPTIIEDGAFIGSDTMLVAPVTVGAGARTGAGSVVTRDVPPRSLVYGVPARVRSSKQEPVDETAESDLAENDELLE
jgi:bifunctional UDP-N-acetylglucosamine pyrophosphorylase/glucosamine-1-phosphate N-acetyltransferase